MSFNPPLGRDGRLKERWVSGKYDELRPLRAKLLEHGGDEVVPCWEPDVERLITEGQIIQPAATTSVNGEPSQCHRNAALLYENEDKTTAIGTGWALSDDGLWRQHSWAMRGDTLVETTVDRVTYFGLILTGNDAETFVQKNRF